MSEIIWGSPDRKRHASKLIEDYERLTRELEQTKKEIVAKYYRMHNLPRFAYNKPADNLNWTEKEFTEMIETLRQGTE